MGIKGLLPLLEAAKERVELVEQRFFGCRVAIDGDGLLYKAAYSCAQELALGQETDRLFILTIKFTKPCFNKFTIRHVRYVIDTVMKMQVMWHLTPIVVFDGEGIPIKYETQEKRRV
jgi:exonuclease-1